MHENEVKVWDIMVRLFHWSLVTTFFICFLTEDSSRLHIYSGYLILVLIICRFIWGFIGSKHARFKDFIVSPSTIINYLKDLIKGQDTRFLGHNPAGTAMIIVLIGSVLTTCITGLALYAVDDHSGPLVFLFTSEHEYFEDMLEEVHELFSNFSLALIILHVTGAIVTGKHHGENLIKSMINGKKEKIIEAISDD